MTYLYSNLISHLTEAEFVPMNYTNQLWLCKRFSHWMWKSKFSLSCWLSFTFFNPWIWLALNRESITLIKSPTIAWVVCQTFGWLYRGINHHLVDTWAIHIQSVKSLLIVEATQLKLVPAKKCVCRDIDIL